MTDQDVRDHAEPMFARSSYLHGDPARIDELVDYVAGQVKPTTDVLIGNLGLGMWVNRATGDALITTVWADDATMRASEAAVTSLRSKGADVMRGIASVEREEILYADVAEPNEVGDVLRVVRMHSDPETLDAHLSWARQVLPDLAGVGGYRSSVVTTDRRAGTARWLSTYRDGIAADVAFSASAPHRTAAVNRGITIDEVAAYEVAIVGIRGAGSPSPRPRAVQLPAEAPV